MDMNHNGLVEAEEIQQLSADKLERIFDGEEPGTVSSTQSNRNRLKLQTAF